jgi:hypothetical protein
LQDTKTRRLPSSSAIKMAGKPVSRILYGAWTLPPLRRGDHSSRSRFAPGLQQPTRGSYRAGPALPSYLALHHAGFAVPPTLLSGRWALTPPFHPCQALSPSATRLRGLLSGCLKVFLQMATEARCTGGLFSVALSVAETSPRLRELREESAPWRYQARCPLV